MRAPFVFQPSKSPKSTMECLRCRGQLLLVFRKLSLIGKVQQQAGRSAAMRRRQHLVSALIAALLSFDAPALADYPDRPVTMVVPFAPGGPADIIARILSTFMPQTLGQ